MQKSQVSKSSSLKSYRNKTLARIWGLAKTKGMDSENLHDFIYGLTNKESMKELSDKQLGFVLFKLQGGRSEQTPKPNMNRDTFFDFLIEQIQKKYKIENITSYLNSITQRQFLKKYSEISLEEKSKLIGILKGVLWKTKKKSTTTI
jgi:hypothetical protein